MKNLRTSILIITLIVITLPLDLISQSVDPVYHLKTLTNQDELDEYLYRAVMNYIDLNDALAGENLKKAAEMIGSEKKENVPFQYDDYMAIASHMIELSQELSQSKIKSIETVSDEFGKINFQLARYYMNYSKDELQNKRSVNSLLYLECASYYFVVSAKWNGNEISEGIRNARKSIDKLNKKSKSGEELDMVEFQKNMDFIEREIDKFTLITKPIKD